MAFTRYTMSLQKTFPNMWKNFNSANLHTNGPSFASASGEKGQLYEKKPIKFLLEKGKTYKWCACGLSGKQRFCDGTHKTPANKAGLYPIDFVPQETKEQMVCNCKQTNNSPFCDGTHAKI